VERHSEIKIEESIGSSQISGSYNSMWRRGISSVFKLFLSVFASLRVGWGGGPFFSQFFSIIVKWFGITRHGSTCVDGNHRMFRWRRFCRTRTPLSSSSCAHAARSVIASACKWKE
jgi:hypothetical protein